MVIKHVANWKFRIDQGFRLIYKNKSLRSESVKDEQIDREASLLKSKIVIMSIHADKEPIKYLL